MVSYAVSYSIGDGGGLTDRGPESDPTDCTMCYKPAEIKLFGMNKNVNIQLFG